MLRLLVFVALFHGFAADTVVPFNADENVSRTSRRGGGD